jgi:hypothetical protein
MHPQIQPEFDRPIPREAGGGCNCRASEPASHRMSHGKGHLEVQPPRIPVYMNLNNLMGFREGRGVQRLIETARNEPLAGAADDSLQLTTR